MRIFAQFVRVSKRFFVGKCALFVFGFCWKKKKRKYEKIEKKSKSQKPPRKLCFWWLWSFFLQNWHFWKMDKHYLWSEDKEKCVFSLQLPVFGKWHFFNIQNHQTLQNLGVSAGTGENPKWHFRFQKCHFGFSPRKGVSLSVIHKSCVLLKTLFYGAFSTTQLCRNKRV